MLCPACHGTRLYAGRLPCPYCEGQGVVSCCEGSARFGQLPAKNEPVIEADDAYVGEEP